ncbi:type I glyceraldehyde-3-phosphate dehydrogenase [Candidatus Collierbacteria bacterium RIFCSPLOWO2_01_FULL_50_23]|uniref:Type I glyceraldehyde-3-phosphate dehydrogenase n=1 Tax=Candidatus Collierbacteria bacterium RIFCSPHIGHO2_01_FULL_50_25 TaxID=1817722 RepID=A0A1F5EUI8_9BACT|nr:MAG: type I glyceraldehyde-3-phosphate dehydrogenase [Candidatus Collierbacteria bacterium RIFCSPHIGHO2_01_FULL_50_25]OGD74719.1 MAG: type I glyceraldehyde-3-phosphate dehydrogenase [Candidatus Collierbacteria bacterium RIFCSPLOWO2_01_FULL_50_23]
MPNFAINGFGRIGRSAARVWLKKHTGDIALAAINTSGSLPASGWALLLKYDTAYGALPYQIEGEDLKNPKETTDADPLIGYLKVTTDTGNFKIPVLAERDPSKIPWGSYQIDVVAECTGLFTSQELASGHIKAGAKNVVISAPVKGSGVPTVVLGVNETVLKEHANVISILSSASCTTNSVAPVAAIMHAKIGVKKAMLMTVHGYTDDQNLQDNSHRDMRRARAAAANIVPTGTGAAISATEAVPELKGLFDGLALRVPVITGSISDFTFVTARATSVEEVNEMFIDAARTPPFAGILAVTNEPLVSSDIVGRSESAIVDLGLTRVVDGDLVKVMAWYDNEWGYSNRLIEQIIKVTEG